MDWVEQIFGINPDGGDGSLEAVIVAGCCTVIVALIVLRFRGPIQEFQRGRRIGGFRRAVLLLKRFRAPK